MRHPPVGVVLSLALHALVALSASRLAWNAPPPVVSAPSRVVWLAASGTLAIAEPEAEDSEPIVGAAVPAEEVPGPPAESKIRAAPTDRAPQTRPAASTFSIEPAQSSPRPPSDLTEARRRAIETVLKERERESSYRSFTFPGTIGEQQAFDEEERQRRVEAGLQEPLTAFDSPSKGRAGLDETTALGVYVRWLSDDCYQTVGTGNLFILPSVQGLAAMPTTICVDPKPRGDLFSAAKPTYLMDEEERAATDEKEQRMERLRRPTTGAVMRLEE